VSYSGGGNEARDRAAGANGNLAAGREREGWASSGPGERDSTSGQAIQEMLHTPDDRTTASKLAIVTANTRSSRYACLNPEITEATLTARSAGTCAATLSLMHTANDKRCVLPAVRHGFLWPGRQVGGRGTALARRRLRCARLEPRIHDAGKLARRVRVLPPAIERT
jgi:hypothetical protein